LPRDFCGHFVIQGLSAAEGALAEEPPDFALQRFTRRVLPGGIAEIGRIEPRLLGSNVVEPLALLK
jgi:hypothetical protein